MLITNTLRDVKKGQITPTFAKVNISLENASLKLKQKIATLIMETEMQNKHSEKRKLKKKIKTDTKHTEKKFELGYFQCSISSIKHSLEK